MMIYRSMQSSLRLTALVVPVRVITMGSGLIQHQAGLLDGQCHLCAIHILTALKRQRTG